MPNLITMSIEVKETYTVQCKKTLHIYGIKACKVIKAATKLQFSTSKMKGILQLVIMTPLVVIV